MKVLVAGNIAKEAIKLIEDAGFDVDVKPDINESKIIGVIKDYDAIIVRSKPKVTAEVIEAAKNLKIIGRAGVGLDNIDIEAAKSKSIEVVNSPEASTISVAEHAVGLMIAIARQTPRAEISLKAGKWEREKFKGFELHDKTLGLIGFGRIGREVAKIAKGLGMKVITNDPYITSEDAAEYDCKYIKFEEVLTNADFISLHVPSTPETKNMINTQTLSKMKETAFLINTSRGTVINEKDLYKALKDNIIAGAALDVYETEPPTYKELFQLNNILTTPHIAANTNEAQIRAGITVAEKVINALKHMNEQK
ncbi:hydroxyacid dehydrogenase [Candidatus Woesearchaeota archaeon]|nr:hydroxyacid dehydrogenase [Candidatus Woesearchaeota archaeon]